MMQHYYIDHATVTEVLHVKNLLFLHISLFIFSNELSNALIFTYFRHQKSHLMTVWPVWSFLRFSWWIIITGSSLHY